MIASLPVYLLPGVKRTLPPSRASRVDRGAIGAPSPLKAPFSAAACALYLNLSRDHPWAAAMIADEIRRPAIAGTFYPAEAGALSTAVQDYLDAARISHTSSTAGIRTRCPLSV